MVLFRYFLALIRIPTPLGIFPEIYDKCSFQVRLQSIMAPRNFVFFTCMTASLSNFKHISFSVIPWFLNNMWWVFLIFSDNLFAFSQRAISVNSFFINFCMSSKFFSLRNKFVSSANNISKLCFHTVCKSLICTRNKMVQVFNLVEHHIWLQFLGFGTIICNKLGSMWKITFKPRVSTPTNTIMMQFLKQYVMVNSIKGLWEV